MVSRIRAAVMCPGRMETKLFDYPEPKEGEMTVKMHMSGVCGSDKHQFDGHLKVDFPVIPGHENVGEVFEETKTASSKMEVHAECLYKGDRILWYPDISCGTCYYCRFLGTWHSAQCENPFTYGYVNCEKEEFRPWTFGGWSEYILLRPGTRVWRIPDEMEDEVAVLLDTLASTRAIARAQMPYPNQKEGFGYGDTVVIQGAGPVGLMAAIRAKVLGADKVIMIGAPDWRLKVAEEFGVDITVGLETFDTGEQRIAEVKRLTKGIGADLVADCTGIPSAFPEAVEMTRKSGYVVEIGAYTDYGPIPFNPWRLVDRDLTVIGQFYCPPMQYEADLKLLKNTMDRFPYKKMLTHKVPLDRAVDAIDAHRALKSMKAAITPS
jgi:threonine dehydrogenase-like Zn-dependent dehydrogenase